MREIFDLAFMWRPLNVKNGMQRCVDNDYVVSEVTWAENSSIWNPISVRLLGRLQLSNPPDLPCLNTCSLSKLRSTSVLHNLTHWGRATHICVGKLTTIGSDNGLSPERRQAIIWTNDGILLIGSWGTNFSEILIGIQTFWIKKMHLKMSSAKWRPSCLGLNVLILLLRYCVYYHFLNNSDFIMHIPVRVNICIVMYSIFIYCVVELDIDTEKNTGTAIDTII